MDNNFADVFYGELLIDNQVDYLPLLSHVEKARALAFSRPELRRKYINMRGILRTTLASYLDDKPENIIIETNQYGKPFLSKEKLYFNLSHTANKFVFAVSSSKDIGIDLEDYRDRKNLAGLVKKCFSVEEQHYWFSLPEPQKISMFYRFWVRKEAFVKAVGRGISIGLDQCVINPYEQTCFLKIPIEYGECLEWQIMEITQGENDFCVMVIKNTPFTYTQTHLK